MKTRANATLFYGEFESDAGFERNQKKNGKQKARQNNYRRFFFEKK